MAHTAVIPSHHITSTARPFILATVTLRLCTDTRHTSPPLFIFSQTCIYFSPEGAREICFYKVFITFGARKLNAQIMEELLKKINAEIANFQENAALQLEKGNKAAGTRARKATLELTKLMKEFRQVSLEESKN